LHRSSTTPFLFRDLCGEIQLASKIIMAALPDTIGLVGVGTIGSAMIRGLCRGEGKRPNVIISPRGQAKAAALAAEFPDLVKIAGSNQEVVDAVPCVIIAVLPKQAEEVMSELKFKEGQQVLSVIATLRIDRLRELASPATEVAIGVPLPAVAHRKGATLLMPAVPFAKTIYDELGTCVAVDDETMFKRMQCMTALMGDFYKRQLTAQQWLEEHSIPAEKASAWIGSIFATMAADSAEAGPETLKHLVEEQTPGGVNELVWRGQEEDKNYESMRYALDQVHVRLMTGQTDASLAPAAQRKP